MVLNGYVCPWPLDYLLLSIQLSSCLLICLENHLSPSLSALFPDSRLIRVPSNIMEDLSAQMVLRDGVLRDGVW